nr:helix-turn-helix transcriptional regulator [uncultured Butyrivibrio sp.]
MRLGKINIGKNAADRISYKLLVTICISGLVGIFMVFMVVNTFMIMRSNSREIAEQEASLTTQHMVANVEEKLENLRQYYLYAAMDDNLSWFISNRLAYSDYNRYKAIDTALGNNAMFPGYINNYVIVNVNNNRVISTRGISDFSQIINNEEILEMFEDNTLRVNRGNWVYNAQGTHVDSKDIQYHNSVDTIGLNFVLNLPIGIYSPKGFLLVNINTDEWKQWIWDYISISGKAVAVLDENGETIYTSDSDFALSCRQKLSSDQPMKADMMKVGGVKEIVAGYKSNILGWTYYVAYDYGVFLGTTSKLMIEFLIAIFALALLSFVSLRNMLYQPVDRLIKEVTEEDSPAVSGNELQFLAGQFANLKNDKEALNQAMIQRREKMAELFETRLNRGAVSAEDEWEEYIRVLGLKSYKLYASVAIILNLRDVDAAEEEINEDAICLALAENLPERLKKIPWLPLIYDSCTLCCIFAEDTEEALMEQISSYYREIKEFTLSTYGYQLQMGVSEIHTLYRHLGRAHHECVYALTLDNVETDQREKGDVDSLGSDCRFYIKPAQTNTDTINLQRYEKEICDGLKAMDKGQCYRILEEFTDQLKNIGEWAVASVYFASLIDTIMMEAIDLKIDILLLCPEGLNKLYQEIMEVGDVKRVRKNMKKMLIDPILLERSKLFVNENYQMMEAIERMLADSKGNITLNECAYELNVTPTYIWKVLKTERGKTFSEYQEEYKIEEAKKLLQTNKSVSDISSELGYTNPQNFIRFFNKGTGMTPGKYRKLILGSI